MGSSKELSSLFLRTIALVREIPKGKVLTYGEVAQLVDSPGSARYVSYILSSSSKKYRLPWHRVINAKGQISEHLAQRRQKSLLSKEGVEFQMNKVDLQQYMWRPSKSTLDKINQL
ncbi:MAG: MGMT family protein [Bdellovibrionales bacterium]